MSALLRQLTTAVKAGRVGSIVASEGLAISVGDVSARLSLLLSNSQAVLITQISSSEMKTYWEMKRRDNQILRSQMKLPIGITGRVSFFSLAFSYNPALDQFELNLRFFPAPDQDCIAYLEITDGRNWQAAQASHRNPPASAGSSTGAAGAGATAAASAARAAQQYLMQQGMLQQQMDQARLNAQQFAQQQPLYLLPPAPPPAKLPLVLTLGELVGYRMWRLDELHQLHSAFADVIWLPGVPMHGAIRDGQLEHGIHSFKSPDERMYEALREYKSPHGVAMGTVAMWGEVIEHEFGYRAEWAAIRTIESVSGVPLIHNRSILREIRESYCPATPDSRGP